MAVSIGLCNWHFLANGNYAGSIAIMLVVLSHSATLMLMNLFVAVIKRWLLLSVCIMHVTIMQLEVSSTLAYNACESFCRKYVGDNFYWNYAVGSLFCNHAGGIFIAIMQVVVSIVAICMYVCVTASSI